MTETTRTLNTNGFDWTRIDLKQVQEVLRRIGAAPKVKEWGFDTSLVKVKTEALILNSIEMNGHMDSMLELIMAFWADVETKRGLEVSARLKADSKAWLAMLHNNRLISEVFAKFTTEQLREFRMVCNDAISHAQGVYQDLQAHRMMLMDLAVDQLIHFVRDSNELEELRAYSDETLKLFFSDYLEMRIALDAAYPEQARVFDAALKPKPTPEAQPCDKLEEYHAHRREQFNEIARRRGMDLVCELEPCRKDEIDISMSRQISSLLRGLKQVNEQMKLNAQKSQQLSNHLGPLNAHLETTMVAPTPSPMALPRLSPLSVR